MSGHVTLFRRTIPGPSATATTTRAWQVSETAWHVARSPSTRSIRFVEHLTYEIVNALALPAEPAPVDLARWSKNIEVLHDVNGAGGAERVRKALLANPTLLAADLELWHSFFVAGFGLPPDCFAKLASDCPSLLTEGDVFTAGCAMLFFKSMGWRNKDIAQRIIGYYPRLLLLDRRRDIDPVVRSLELMDCRGDNLRLLVWELILICRTVPAHFRQGLSAPCSKVPIPGNVRPFHPPERLRRQQQHQLICCRHWRPREWRRRGSLN